MTFEEYQEKHLQGQSGEFIRLVRMGWNARGSYGDTEQASVTCHDKGRGDVAVMGDITDEEGITYHRGLLVQFKTREDFQAAVTAGQCRFSVFGGDA